MPEFYKRCMDNTLSITADTKTAEKFLATLNESHPSVSFTMELVMNSKLPFLGTEIMQQNLQSGTTLKSSMDILK